MFLDYRKERDTNLQVEKYIFSEREREREMREIIVPLTSLSNRNASSSSSLEREIVWGI